MKAVFDSGPVIHLSWIGHLHLLPALFEDLLIPPAVNGELLAPPEGTRGVAEIRRMIEQGTLHVQQPLTSAAFSQSWASSLGTGESEAILLAEDIGADVFVCDDAAARTIAKRRGLPTTGTLGILRIARHDGLIQSVLPLALELRRLGQYLDGALLAEIERNEHIGPIQPSHGI